MYTKQYRVPKDADMSFLLKEYPDKAPVWCPVDLRDGNQSLVTPMSILEKLEYFDLLTKLGFREIEVGFPASSETEFRFIRTLIEEERIPDGVTIQVLTQAREHIIKRTAECVKGAKNVIVHLYSATSPVYRDWVFEKSAGQVKKMTFDAALLMKELFDGETGVRFEYSPECFPETEPEFALEVCSAVLDVWKPDKERPAIINLPGTVEYSLPHVFAAQVGYMDKNLPYRDSTVLSVHTHNDRGCAVAAAEMSLLSGAQRVEGTLFGNGERAGNADIVTLALNMYTLGVDPGIDLTELPEISEVYERVTGMQIPDRQPYSGKLVYTAFSGSHQDAIAKGMHHMEKEGERIWRVPYLPVNPADIGRTGGDGAIRINSQSGKGGVGYLLEKNYGYAVPKAMQESVGGVIKRISDERMAELSPEEVRDAFEDEFVNVPYPLALEDVHFAWNENGSVTSKLELTREGGIMRISGDGSTRFSAAANAVRNALGVDFTVFSYAEHTTETGVEAKVITYIGIDIEGTGKSWGAGMHTDIIISSIRELLSALNREGREKI